MSSSLVFGLWQRAASRPAPAPAGRPSRPGVKPRRPRPAQLAQSNETPPAPMPPATRGKAWGRCLSVLLRPAGSDDVGPKGRGRRRGDEGGGELALRARLVAVHLVPVVQVLVGVAVLARLHRPVLGPVSDGHHGVWVGLPIPYRKLAGAPDDLKTSCSSRA